MYVAGVVEHSFRANSKAAAAYQGKPSGACCERRCSRSGCPFTSSFHCVECSVKAGQLVPLCGFGTGRLCMHQHLADTVGGARTEVRDVAAEHRIQPNRESEHYTKKWAQQAQKEEQAELATDTDPQTKTQTQTAQPSQQAQRKPKAKKQLACVLTCRVCGHHASFHCVTCSKETTGTLFAVCGPFTGQDCFYRHIVSKIKPA